MNYPCNLIRDLLPLYHDEVACEESNRAIEEHLKACSSCASYYQRLCASDLVEPAAYEEELAQKAAFSYQKVLKKLRKIFVLAVLSVLGLLLALYLLVLGYFFFSGLSSKEVYRDASQYNTYRSGDTILKNFDRVKPADEIFPEKIGEGMKVQDFLMMYYNPFDANYLGCLTVQYDEASYQAEKIRLSSCPSMDYAGNYGASGFSGYEVLAMYSGMDGFVYALTDEKDTIIYVELIFPGSMDLPYEKYIPKKYLPDGLNISKENPTQQIIIDRNKLSRERYQSKKHGSLN